MTVQQELEAIRRSHRGVLNPRDVVEYAKDRKTALHSRFTWDNDAAAAEYRLWQAREIIRVVVRHEEHIEKNVRVYVSLRADRAKGGGYRALVDVLGNEARRQQLLAEAFDDFERWEAKYDMLAELAPIFEAAKTARK